MKLEGLPLSAATEENTHRAPLLSNLSGEIIFLINGIKDKKFVFIIFVHSSSSKEARLLSPRYPAVIK